MPRITRSRAIARLIAKWLDHRLHRPENVKALPLSKWLTDENIAATAALDRCTVFDEEIEDRHRRHMLLRAWMADKPQGRCNEARRTGRRSQWLSAGLYKKPVRQPFLKSQ